MHRAMHADDPSFDAIPNSADLIAQYLLLYSTSVTPGDFDNYVDTNYRNGLIMVFVKAHRHGLLAGPHPPRARVRAHRLRTRR
jgi:hypothetical protein